MNWEKMKWQLIRRLILEKIEKIWQLILLIVILVCAFVTYLQLPIFKFFEISGELANPPPRFYSIIFFIVAFFVIPFSDIWEYIKRKLLS